MKNSFKTNDFNSNNLSYNTYNKTLDTNNIYANDSDRDPQDNYSKKRKPKKLARYERISEKTNDYEDEDNNIFIQNRNVFINNEYNQNSQSNIEQSQEGESEVRDSDLYPSNYHKKKRKIERQTEFEDDDEINYLDSDIIQSSTEEEMLLNKINKHGKQIQMNLIYKATIDTDRAEIFHQKCDRAQRTLVVIESISDRRFGGYTTQSWAGDGIDKDDEEAFVFSLDKLQIYNIISGQPAIGCYPKYGQYF